MEFQPAHGSAASDTSLPAPIPTGTDTYYADRLADFVRRHAEVDPPPYYADFGDKCLHQFRLAQPELSESRQVWLENTLCTLQEMMEDKRRSDPHEFAALELDGDAFQKFASGTHSTAYVESGLFELPATDLWKILRTPDAADLLTAEGIAEIAKVVGQLESDDVAEIATATLEDLSKE